jgi:Ca-activated chloride channel family protein
MTESTKDLYEVLGISPAASQSEVRRAYRALARRYHPDSGKENASVERFQQVQAAYEVLGDLGQRRAYDRQRAERHPADSDHFDWEILISQSELPILPGEQMAYLLADIVPGERSQGQRLPINMVIVVDRSTSMRGRRLEHLKTAAHQIVDDLADQDALGIVAFSDRAEVVVPSQRLVNRARIHNLISSIWTSGGTEILQGVQAGLDEVRRFHARGALSHLLLVTDGQTYGDEEECLGASRQARTERIIVSTLGLGDDWNDELLEEMARLSGGDCFYVAHASQLRHVLDEYVRGLSGVVARDLAVTVRLNEQVHLVDAFRCSSTVDRLAFDRGEIKLGILQGGGRIQVLFEFIVTGGKQGTRHLAQLELRGRGPRSDRWERLLFDFEVGFVADPDPVPVPNAIINAMNRINIFRMQESAWKALEAGEGVDARRQLEAVATRLFDLGERELARIALLEAGRVTQGGQASKKGQKTIRFGTRRLGGNA